MLALAAPWLALVLLAVVTADHLVASTLCCADDAYLAGAAKNLGLGNGYSSTYDAGAHAPWMTGEFAPGITTGPTLLIPVAVAIRWLGVHYWVPGAVSWASCLLLLATLMARLLERGGTTAAKVRRSLAALLAVAALTVVTIGYFEHWYALLGEGTALLLAAHGLLSVAAPRDRRELALGALLLGLAIATKSLALLVLPPALLFAALNAARRDGERSGGTEAGALRTGTGSGAPARPPRSSTIGTRARAAATAVLVVGAVSIAPTAAFESYKLFRLGPAGHREMTVRWLEFVRNTGGSGLQATARTGRVAAVVATARANTTVLARYFRSPAWIGFLAVLVVGLAARRRWRGVDSPRPLALYAAATGYFVWWIPLSNGGRVRYLLLGLGLASLAVAFDVALDGWSRRKLVVLALLVGSLAPRLEIVSWIRPPTPWFARGARVESMLAAAKFLEQRRAGRPVVAEWWAVAADMEYLLPGGGLSEASSLDGAPRDVLYFENAKWLALTPERRVAWSERLARAGAVPVFESGSYRVYETPPVAAPAP